MNWLAWIIMRMRNKMNIVIERNKYIQMSSKTESGVIEDILKYCKIKHYHIINKDKLLDYKDRKFIDFGSRIYLDMDTGRFEVSFAFWDNFKKNPYSKVICLGYKPTRNKLNLLLAMLNEYNNLSILNYIPKYIDK